MHIPSSYTNRRLPKPAPTRGARRAGVIFGICFLLCACGAVRVDERGYRDATEELKTIKEGTSTKDDVLTALGTPSTQSDFGPQSWYYIHTTRESVAFFKPEITAQKVTRIQFDDAGLVTKIETYDLSQSKDVTIVQDITPTEGHKLGMMEQILGNLLAGFCSKDPSAKKPK